MAIFSMISFFLTQHPFLSWPLLIVVGALLGRLIAKWSPGTGWLLFIGMFLYGSVNPLVAHIVNAGLLNAAGTYGSGVITHSTRTNSTMNGQHVWAYDVVLKTADGRDVVTTIDTFSATFYPIANSVLLPPEGERFAIKYVPGFPRNFVIMRDESPYGVRYLVAQDRRLVEKATKQLAASPGNPAFVAEYRDALAMFVGKHRNDADPALIQRYELKLKALSPKGRELR